MKQEEVEDRSEEKKNEAWTIDMNTFTTPKYSCLR